MDGGRSVCGPVSVLSVGLSVGVGVGVAMSRCRHAGTESHRNAETARLAGAAYVTGRLPDVIS